VPASTTTRQTSRHFPCDTSTSDRPHPAVLILRITLQEPHRRAVRATVPAPISADPFPGAPETSNGDRVVRRLDPQP
jgi:hypothetical protein